jgi:hypothetical protein
MSSITMFGKRSKSNALPLPPLARDNPAAVEDLRAWATPHGPQQVILEPTWADPAAWGLMLVDIAHHAANAYARSGVDARFALERIREAWEAEWSNRSDTALDITSDAEHEN